MKIIYGVLIKIKNKKKLAYFNKLVRYKQKKSLYECILTHVNE